MMLMLTLMMLMCIAGCGQRFSGTFGSGEEGGISAGGNHLPQEGPRGGTYFMLFIVLLFLKAKQIGVEYSLPIHHCQYILTESKACLFADPKLIQIKSFCVCMSPG